MRRQANDNSYLFPREVETVDEVVNRQPDLDLTYNRVFALRQLADPTAEVHKYRVADDDQGAAELLRKLAKYPKIKISGTEATTNIYKASDIWALGAMFYALSNKNYPFGGSSEEDKRVTPRIRGSNK